MNRKTLFTLAILLVLGAGAIAVIQSRGGKEQGDGSADGNANPSLAGSSETAAVGGAPASGSAKPARSARDDRFDDLADRYGRPRTNLSKQVAGNVVALLEDAIEMGEMMQDAGRRGNWGGGGRWMTRAVASQSGVELKDEQQEAVTELYREFRAREMEKAKVAVNGLKKDPSALMELFLAGDARTREEMSDSEYESVVSSAAGDLNDVINPLDRNNFRGGRPMEDETFRSDFEALLDEDQLAAYTASQEEKAAAAEAAAAEGGEAPKTGNITELPTMELETLDQAVVSAKQMASGFKQMMQGMGGLQDLQPQINPQGGGQ